MKKSKLIPLSVLAIASFLNACKSDTKKETETTRMEQKETIEKTDIKTVAMNAQDAFFTNYDAEGVKTLFTENYIQHNPNVPTGRTTVVGFLPVLEEAGTSVKTHRVLKDGSFVVMHNSYDNAEAFGAKELVAFDVYRVEDGKVAEHWDNLQPVVEKTASGRSQVDGSTEITDKEKTEANKTLVTNFVNDILMNKNPDKITDYINTEMYHQHNPAIEDGLAGLGKAIDYLVSQNDMFSYTKLHKTLGEGNFVFTMSEGEWHGKPHAFFDLFRIQGGKIVEHWDVISEIPSEMAHDNGKF